MAINPRVYEPGQLGTLPEELTRDPRRQEDPGKSVSEMAKEQAVKLVENISSKSLVELTDLRDHIDTLMRALKLRNETLCNEVENLAGLAADVVGMKSIVRDSLSQLTERLTPAPKTITQRNNGHE